MQSNRQMYLRFGFLFAPMGCSQTVKARDFDSRIVGSIPAIPARILRDDVSTRRIFAYKLSLIQ